MPHLNSNAVNLAFRDFGNDLLNSAKEALSAALPDQAAKVAEVLAQLQSELQVELSPKRGKRGAKAAAAAAGGAPVAKRAPSEYNVFMGEGMRRLGATNKGLSKSELMKLVAAEWKELKAKKAGAAAAPAAPQPKSK